MKYLTKERIILCTGKYNIMIPLLVLIHSCQLFLSQMHEIFVLSWLGFPKTSQRLPKTSKHCRRIMSEDVPMTFENFQSYIKRDIFDVVVTWVSGFLSSPFFLGNSVVDTFRTQSQHKVPFLDIRVVTKISSCRVNTTSRRGIERLGISFGSIFLLFSNKSSRGPLS